MQDRRKNAKAPISFRRPVLDAAKVATVGPVVPDGVADSDTGGKVQKESDPRLAALIAFDGLLLRT